MKRTHWLIDWWLDDPTYLDRHAAFRIALEAAVKKSELNVLETRYHDFEPKGFTGVLILQESHVAVHSWWEEGLLTLDVFSCRSEGIEGFVETLRNAVCPHTERIREVPRGVAVS